jgi:hypothetical protein
MEVAKSLAPLAPTASMVPCDVLKTINRKCRALICFACDHSTSLIMLLKHHRCSCTCLRFLFLINANFGCYYVECIELHLFVILNSKLKYLFYSSLLLDARSTLASISRTSNVVWTVDPTHLSGGSRHCVSLKSLYFVLPSMVERFIEMWTEVRVRIYFQKVDTDRETTEELYRAAFTPHISDTEESTWLKGRLMIQFGYSKKKVLS